MKRRPIYLTAITIPMRSIRSFSLFGEEFKNCIENDLRSDEALENAVRDFLEIGSTRNELVHENFANFTLDKTAKEIYELYRSASIFTDYLAGKFT